MTARDELTRLLERLGEEERELVRRLAEDVASDISGTRSSLFAVVHDLSDQQVRQVLGVAQAY